MIISMSKQCESGLWPLEAWLYPLFVFCFLKYFCVNVGLYKPTVWGHRCLYGTHAHAHFLVLTQWRFLHLMQWGAVPRSPPSPLELPPSLRCLNGPSWEAAKSANLVWSGSVNFSVTSATYTGVKNNSIQTFTALILIKYYFGISWHYIFG